MNHCPPTRLLLAPSDAWAQLKGTNAVRGVYKTFQDWKTPLAFLSVALRYLSIRSFSAQVAVAQGCVYSHPPTFNFIPSLPEWF